MTTIAILAEQSDDPLTAFSAVAGARKANGRTVGEALDALTSQLSADEPASQIIVQAFHPDPFFSAAQRDRLAELMVRWREGRETGKALTSQEQAELETLVNKELQASTERTAHFLADLEWTPLLRRSEQMSVELMTRRKEGRWRASLVESARLLSHFVGNILLATAGIFLLASSMLFGLIFIFSSFVGMLLSLNSVNIYLGSEKRKRRGESEGSINSLGSSADRLEQRTRRKAR